MHEEQKLILIFDGLDEKLTHYEQEEQDRFLNELMSVVNTKKGKVNKTVFSCRNHYFETAVKQNHFLLGQSRENQQSKDFIALDILPLSQEDVKAFLAKRLDEDEVNKLMRYIGEDKYLGSIASRPFMLTKIVELLPQLAKLKEENQKLNTASFYKALINDTLGRDEPKHSIKERDKKFTLMHLAFYMYQESTQYLSIDELNIWFLDLLETEKQLRHYNLDKSYKLEKDLRNSTLLVRFGEDDFGFSHSSIYEYFLSQYTLEYWEEISVKKQLSSLTNQFLLDSVVNLKERDKNKLLPKIINTVAKKGHYWITLSLDLLSILNLEITKLEINNMSLIGYIFKNLRINNLYINDCVLTDSQFINSKIQNLIVINSDFSHGYFENTNIIKVEEKDSIWKNITLLNSKIDVSFPVKHDYSKKNTKNNEWFNDFEANYISDINALSFTSNGNYIISALFNNTLKLWDINGKLLKTFYGHIKAIKDVNFSPSGETILSASSDKTLKLWNLKGDCLQTFEGHTNDVNSISFSPSGETILSASSDKTLKLWNLKGDCLQTFEGHRDFIHSVKFNFNGDKIGSASFDKRIKIWNLDGECLQTINTRSKFVMDIEFSSVKDEIISGSSDGSTRVWNIITGMELTRMYATEKEWYSLNFQNKTAKGTPMSWKLSNLSDKEGNTFTIDKLKGFEVYEY